MESGLVHFRSGLFGDRGGLWGRRFLQGVVVLVVREVGWGVGMYCGSGIFVLQMQMNEEEKKVAAAEERRRKRVLVTKSGSGC